MDNFKIKFYYLYKTLYRCRVRAYIKRKPFRNTLI